MAWETWEGENLARVGEQQGDSLCGEGRNETSSHGCCVCFLCAHPSNMELTNTPKPDPFLPCQKSTKNNLRFLRLGFISGLYIDILSIERIENLFQTLCWIA